MKFDNKQGDNEVCIYSELYVVTKNIRYMNVEHMSAVNDLIMNIVITKFERSHNKYSDNEVLISTELYVITNNIR